MTKTRLDLGGTVEVAAGQAVGPGSSIMSERYLSRPGSGSSSGSNKKNKRDKKQQRQKKKSGRRKSSIFACFAPGLPREAAYGGRMPVTNGTVTRIGQASGSAFQGAPGNYGRLARTDIAYVELSRLDGESFGLIIAGGSDHDEPVTIADLREGGIAKRTELLEIGDRILAVNGTSTEDIPHDAVVRLLQTAGTIVYLEVEYDLPEGAPPVEAATLKKRIAVDVLGEADGFGFKLRGGVDEGLNRPLTIAYIRAGCDLHKKGTIKVGDRLMHINDRDVTEFTLSEAITALRGAQGLVNLEIEYDVTVQAALQDNDPGAIILVELIKPPGVSLGLTLNGSSDPGEPISISDIRPGGIADRCGALHQYDRLLAIDGHNLERATLPQAVAMLIKVEHIVRLEILPMNRTVQSPMTANHNSASTAMAVSSSDPEDGDNLPAPPEEILHDGGSAVGLNGNRSGRTSPAVGSDWERFRPPTLQTTSVGAPSSNGYGVTSGPHTPTSHGDSALGSETASTQSTMRPRAQTYAPSTKPKPPVSRRHSSLLAHDRDSSSQSGSLSVVDRHVLPTHSAMQLCRQETLDLELMADPFGYGFSITGGRASGGPIAISSIEKDSPADRVGVMQVGDRLITINGVQLANMNLDDVCKLIRESGGHMMLHLEFDVADGVKPTSGVFDVRLYKNTTSLGLTINGGEGDGMWISQVKNGGVAYRSGLVERGDGLMAINSVYVGTATLSEAAGMLRDSTDIVVLQIRKKERQAELDDSVEFTVELVRRGRSLGITLNGSTLPGEPIYISDIREDGIVHRTGALQKGDIILSINGQSLRKCNVPQAVRMLAEVGDRVQLKIQRTSKRSYGSDTDSQVSSLATASFPSPLRNSRDLWQTGRGHGAVGSDEDALSGGSTPSAQRASTTLSSSRSSQIGSVGNRTSSGVAASFSLLGGNGQSKPILKRPGSAGQEGRKRWSEMPSTDTAITASLPTATVRVPTRQQTSFTSMSKGGSSSTTHTTNSLTRHPRVVSAAPYGDTGSLSRSELSNSHLAAPSDTSLQSSPMTESRHLYSAAQSVNDPTSLLEELESSLLDSSTFTSLLSSAPSTTGTVTQTVSASTPSIVAAGGAIGRRSSFRQAVPSSRPMAADRHSLDGGERGVTPTVQSVEMHVIELSRAALNISFGFSISDGLSESGVYIRGLMPGGIAQMQSKLKPLDRVLQINGVDVRDHDCRSVLPILSNVRESLRMVVCRCSQPRSMSGLSSPTSFK